LLSGLVARLGALEQLAMEMKATGMYVSRGLSFAAAEFSPMDVHLTFDQEMRYVRPLVYHRTLHSSSFQHPIVCDFLGFEIAKE
jgi:hypothetical protein